MTDFREEEEEDTKVRRKVVYVNKMGKYRVYYT